VDIAAVLAVQVKVDGLAQAAAQVQALEADLRKAQQSAAGAGVGFDQAGGSAGGLGQDVSRAAAQVEALENDMRKASQAASSVGGGLDSAAGSASGFDRDLQKARATAQSAGQDFDKVARSVGDVGQATEKAAGSMGSDLENAAHSAATVGDGLEKAATSTNLFRDAQGKLRNEMGRFATDAEKAAAGLKDVDEGAGGGRGGFSDLTSVLGGTSSGFGALGGSIAIALPLLVGMAGPLAAVGSALLPLAGLGAAGAVGFSALAQGAGVLTLATSGVAAALKEQTTNQASMAQAAVTAAGQQRAAAQSIAAAQQQVRSAREQVTTATEGLTNAEQAQRQAEQQITTAQQQARSAQTQLNQARVDGRRALQDMHDALNDSIVTEQRAILNLQDAKQALQTTLAGTSPEDLAKAQAQVTSAANDQTQAVLDLQRAQAQLAAVNADSTSSDVDRQQAMLDVSKAQDQLTQAQFRSTDAQSALAKAQAGPSEADKAKAVLQVTDAQDQLTQSTRARARQQTDATAADAKGVDGTQQVVAAQKQLTAAHQQVTDAQRTAAKAAQQVTDAHRQLNDASTGVTRAVRAVADAQASARDSAAGAAQSAGQLNKAMDALTPPARRFVQQLVDLKPKLDDLKATAASGLFPGVVDGLNAAKGAFAPVRQVVGDTAQALGGLADKAGQLIGSPAFAKDIATVGDRNAKIMGTLGDAALHIGDALRNIIVAAGPLTSWLADLADHWARVIDQQTGAARQSGQLTGFFEKTRAVVSRLVDILGNVASGLLGIAKVGAGFGDGILASLDNLTARFAKWANSVQGQQQIRQFFQTTTGALRDILPVLAKVADAFGSLAIDVLPPLAKVLQTIAPFTTEIVAAFLAYKVVATAVEGVTKAVTTVSKAWTLAQGAAKIATAGWTAAQWLLNAALDANPIGATIIAIAALAAGVVVAYEKIGFFHDIVDAAFSFIETTILGTWSAIDGPTRAVWDGLKAYFTTLFAFLSGAFQSALDGIKEMFSGWSDAVSGIVKIFSGLLSGDFGKMWDGIKETFRGALDVVLGLVKAVTAPMRETAVKIGDAISGPIGAAFDFIKTSVVGPVVSWLAARWGDIHSGAVTAWDAIKTAITAPITAAVGAVKGLFSGKSGLQTILSSAWDDITLGAKVFGLLFRNAMERAFANVVNSIIGFVKTILHAISLIPGVPDFGKGLNTISVPAALSVKDATKQVQGLAEGGIVSKPIVMMGEEAPRHPEFVIPTNPAYRGRAQMLLGQAAKAIGFAQGGILSFNQLESTWVGAGGSPAAENIMAHVAEAESSGDPLARNPSGAAGLWQILGQVVPGDLFNPTVNALNAIKKSDNGTNLHPWDASRSVWGQFLGSGDSGGGPLGSIGGAIGSAAGTVAGVAGDVASAIDPVKLFNDVKNAMPSVSALPDWLQSMGSTLVSQAISWAERQVTTLGGLIGSGGGSTNTGSGASPSGTPSGLDTFDGLPVAEWIIPELQYARQHGWAGHITSGYRTPAASAALGFPNDEHTIPGPYPHGAVDFGGMTDPAGFANRAAFEAAAAAYKGQRLLEPMGFHDDGHMSGTGHAIGGILGQAGGLLGGVPFTLPFGGAFADGGIVPGAVGEPVAIVAHGGETVTPAGQSAGGMTVQIVHTGDVINNSPGDSDLEQRRLVFRLQNELRKFGG
jgi:Transglycosylase SLT domain